MSEAEPPRLEHIDTAKGALILGVVTIHLAAGPLSRPSELGAAGRWFLVLLDTASRACVPGFILLAAALAAGSLGRSSPGRWLLRRAGRLLPAYLFWTAVLVLLPGTVHWAPRLAVAAVCGSAAYHTYFVPLLLHLFAVMPLLRPLRPRSRQATVAAAIGGVVAASAVRWWLLPVASLLADAGPTSLYLANGPVAALTFLPYAWLGLLLHEPIARPDGWRRAWLGPLALASLVSVAWHRAVLLPGLADGDAAGQQRLLGFTAWDTPVVALPVLAWLLACRSRPWLARLGRASYGIYLSHVVWLELLRREPVLRQAMDTPWQVPFWVACLTAWSYIILTPAALARWLRPLAGLALLSLVCGCSTSPPRDLRPAGQLRTAELVEPPPGETRVRAVATAKGMAWPLREVTVGIDKSDRRLVLSSRGRQVKVYHVGLGRNPRGDKRQEGDGRTPEGEFYVCTRNVESQFHLFLGLSYPSIDDAERGLAAGLIAQAEAADIRDAIAGHRGPSWDTKLGGRVGIHGHGAHRDWTQVCIAVDDADIEELFAVCDLGTEVTIEP